VVVIWEDAEDRGGVGKRDIYHNSYTSSVASPSGSQEGVGRYWIAKFTELSASVCSGLHLSCGG
jgi:hypothetical protein